MEVCTKERGEREGKEGGFTEIGVVERAKRQAAGEVLQVVDTSDHHGCRSGGRERQRETNPQSPSAPPTKKSPSEEVECFRGRQGRRGRG